MPSTTEYLRAAAHASVSEEELDMSKKCPMIRAEKISYTYPVYESTDDFDGAARVDSEATKDAPKAIEDINLEIEQGSFVCIIGRNGSGKSTFARHLNALLVPDEGTVWIDGKNSADEDLIPEIRKTTGMVFQNPDNQIVASIVEEDVAFGPENIGIPSDEMQRRVDLSLVAVDMSDYAHSSPNKLSGGQKQRVAVAGILAMDPKCIVLDEATAMLDPIGREEVMSTVKRLNRENGITVIAITHYMDEALDADYIYVIDNSRLVMEGTPREIFSRPEELNRIGLRLPQITELGWKLKKQGLDIPDGILSTEELVRCIIHLRHNGA